MDMKMKLFFGFLLVSVLSVSVTIGTYSYLNKNEGQLTQEEFKQTGYRTVGFSNAAENTDFTLAAEQSLHAVVHIKSIAQPSQRDSQGYFDPFEFFFGGQGRQFQRQPRVGFGSGVIISTDGYIVTNNHVIDGANEIEVTMNDNQTYTAKLIGGDESTDIALLKIEGNSFPVIPFGDSDALKVGEWVLAVGNPFNLTSTVTAGIVSAKGRGSVFSDYRGRRGRSQTQEKIQSFIQTDAAVNPGNSGGALVNISGELVGINTAIYSETGNFVGYSFAIPISMVKKVVTDIKQYGAVQRALLGVTITELSVLKETEPDKYNKLKVKDGVYVQGFSSNSSAEKAGLKEGDVITGINGHKIKSFQELRAEISRFNPGNEVAVQVQRGDDIKTYNVELKNDQGTTEVLVSKKPAEILGATFNELSDEIKSKFGINYGVEVASLTDGKLKQIGIREKFIILTANSSPVNSGNDLEKLVEVIMKNTPDDRGLFLKGIYPNGKVTYYAIDLNE